MAIIDMHAHIYPEKLARKAVESVGDFYGYHAANEVASAEGLLAAGAAAGFTHYGVFSVATKEHHVASINEFIAAECAAHPEFIGFGTAHAECADFAAVLDDIQAKGLHGIKLHPDMTDIPMDDPRLMELYAQMERRGVGLIMHCGDYRSDLSHPRRMQRILREFPRLNVDAAHFGGWLLFDYALEFLEDERCFVDCSSSLSLLGPRRARELIEAYGPDRVIFGTDFPLWNHGDELALLHALGLSKRDEEAITWHNAERFVGMDIR